MCLLHNPGGRRRHRRRWGRTSIPASRPVDILRNADMVLYSVVRSYFFLSACSCSISAALIRTSMARQASSCCGSRHLSQQDTAISTPVICRCLSDSHLDLMTSDGGLYLVNSVVTRSTKVMVEGRARLRLSTSCGVAYAGPHTAVESASSPSLTARYCAWVRCRTAHVVDAG